MASIKGWARTLGGTAVAALAIGFVILAMGRFSGRGAGPPPRAPILLRVGNDSSIAIGAAQFHEQAFRLPDRLCTLSGRIESAGGEPRQFEALVLTDGEYRGWSGSHRGGGVGSGRVERWEPSATLVGPGRYHLVVSNVASPVGGTVVRIDVRISCS